MAGLESGALRHLSIYEPHFHYEPDVCGESPMNKLSVPRGRHIYLTIQDSSPPSKFEGAGGSENLLRVRSLSDLHPTLAAADVLLSDWDLLSSLNTDERTVFSTQANTADIWVMLYDIPPPLFDQLCWQSLGVNNFLPRPHEWHEWPNLLGWIRSRQFSLRSRLFSQEIFGEGEARFRFFLDNVEEGVVVCDNGIIVDVSDRWLELFRCPREKAVGQPVLHFTSPDIIPLAIHLIEERWAEAYESEMLRLDGTRFPAIVRGRNQIFNGRELRLTTILDVTRQKEAQQALTLAKEEAERANQAKSDFLSSMSHELRTPLNAILGFTQILEMNENLSDLQIDSIREILKAGTHLRNLINEVLDLASIESGRIPLSLEGVDASELLRNCIQLVHPLAESNQLSITLEIPDDIVVLADHQRLKQVVLNLLSNAIKYNKPSGKVTISATSDDEIVTLSITDTGAGISAEQIKELFKPFTRLKAEQQLIEGTGIGLVITRKLTEAMGGTITVQSEPDQGSCFQITLPVTDLNLQPDTTATEIKFSHLIARKGQRNILYIDDNPVNLKLVSRILEKLRNIHLVTIHSPEIGIEFALTNKPDLIMLDINLPGMNGYEVLKILQSHLQLRHVPVIAISANAMPRDIERGVTAGFADYLTKPLDIGRFISSIDAHLPESLDSPAAVRS